uniref:Uncharacterized protein n=1 Tax=Candidatus Kentrum sp. LPFa TaxID=2126335 RepID=A0A450VZK6_9GAMM|nr:MAG: hypothetical protein BECKLPF1236B_GA0070989_10131 [Candidatus Kentron sp. LPFa]
MSRDFSHITFFQRIANFYLYRYFCEKHGVLHKVPFGDIGDSRKAAKFIHQAIAELPGDKQAEIETECQDIESMANPEGVIALIEEARDVHGNADFAEAIDDLTDDFRDKAMWAFLEYPDYWPGVVSILYAENVREVFWKKRNDLPHVFAHLESQDIRQLEHALSNYFFRKQRRGRHCKIDVYRKQGREYLFAYLSDFSRSDMEWDKTFTPRSRIPTFKIIFVYTKTEGSLDIHAPKNTKHTDRLRPLRDGIFSNS